MTAPRPRSGQPKQLDAGRFQAEIGSFRLRLAAEGKAAKTVRTYTEAMQWFAASYLLEKTGRTGWEQASGQDAQGWMVRLLDRYSSAYASNQYRGLQQFFKRLAAEEGMPDPMTGLQPPHVTQNLVPVFTDGDCGGRSTPAGAGFVQRRDAAMIAVFKGSGVRRVGLARSGTTPATAAAMSTCGSGRSLSAARPARPGSSRSATTPPAASTGICGSGPGMRRRTGRSCGSGRATGGRSPPAGSTRWSPATAGSAEWTFFRTGSGIISVTPGWTAAARKET